MGAGCNFYHPRYGRVNSAQEGVFFFFFLGRGGTGQKGLIELLDVVALR